MVFLWNCSEGDTGCAGFIFSDGSGPAGRLSVGRFGHGKDDEKLAEKIKELLDRKRIPAAKDAKNRFVTLSIGVATAVPTVDNDYYELYDAAETAMFTAKDKGGDCIETNSAVYESKQPKGRRVAVVG